QRRRCCSVGMKQRRRWTPCGRKYRRNASRKRTLLSRCTKARCTGSSCTGSITRSITAGRDMFISGRWALSRRLSGKDRFNILRYIYRMADMQIDPSPVRTVNVTRYVTPLREGGSLPAIAEADDGFLYVLKFRGAGQGVKALIADLIGGELARVLGLKVPELVFARLDPAFGRTEGDEEIQDLLKASTGLNLALHYLSGAITYDPRSE